jgi:hypothetical protein
MNVIWTPLTGEELVALKEGDPIVTHTGSKGAFQFLQPSVYTRNSFALEK